MKKFIAFAIFLIGMMLVWPPGEYAKASTTDQVCVVVADIGHSDCIAIEKVRDQYQTFEFEALKPPGIATAENVVQKSPDFSKFSDLNYRTCLYAQAVRNKNKLLTKNIMSVDRIRIRDDTSI